MKSTRVFRLILAAAILLVSLLSGCQKADSGLLSSAASSETPTKPDGYTGETLVVYPEYDPRIERDSFYSVSVTQGAVTKPLTCYNHCDDVATSNRTRNGDGVRRFCEFAFTQEAVRVDITVKCDFSSYTVMPSAKNFRSECNGNVISVYLDKPEYFLVKLDNLDDSILSVFADEPEYDVPDRNDPNVLYIEGWYEPENGTQLLIGGSQRTVYLAPGSVVNARVKMIGDIVTLKGRGILLDPYSDLYRTDASEVGYHTSENRYLLNISGTYCTVDGVKLIDARDYNLTANAGNLSVKNLKILSSEMCTDGISQFSGKNNSYEHCFIYNGDNALVLSHGEDCSFRDITVGTSCCGIYPQSSVGAGYTLDGLYFFRCDEALLKNVYNNGSAGTTGQSFDLEIRNVSAVDCDHFPFIFAGGNMGDRPKNVTFHNLAVPTATGSDSLGSGDGKTVRFLAGGSMLETSNYRLTFDGLSIGGRAVTSADSLPMTGPVDNNTVTVTGNGCTDQPAVANTVPKAVTAPGKIFIGNRQLFLPQDAVEQDGSWLVPAAEVCQALLCKVPDDTVNIQGVAYVSLQTLTASGCTSSAVYDPATRSIRIAPSTLEDNLLSWYGNSAHSYWGEAVCYQTHLVYRKDADGDVYYNKDSGTGAGAYYNLTRQIQQYGSGEYVVTVDMKADRADHASVFLSVNRSWNPEIVSLTTEWQTVTLTFDVRQDNPFNAYFAITATSRNPGIAFRNAKIVHKG